MRRVAHPPWEKGVHYAQHASQPWERGCTMRIMLLFSPSRVHHSAHHCATLTIPGTPLCASLCRLPYPVGLYAPHDQQLSHMMVGG